MNNLKQLSLGLHLFENTHKRLPCSSRDPDWISESGAWSWGANVLPFIEQREIYDRCDFSAWPAEQQNLEIIGISIPTFRCPSEVIERHQGTSVWNGFERVKIDLPNDNFGINEPLDMLNPNGADCWRFADIRDGLSNSIMLGETTAFQFPDDSTPTLHWHITWACTISATEGADTERDFWSTIDCNDITSPSEQSWNYLCSYHAGGSHVSLCDGSVVFVSNSIDTQTLKELADPADGKPIGDWQDL